MMSERIKKKKKRDLLFLFNLICIFRSGSDRVLDQIEAEGKEVLSFCSLSKFIIYREIDPCIAFATGFR